MTISDILAQAKLQLEHSSVANAKLDALILLSYTLSFSKEQIIFNPDMALSQEQQKTFLALVKRRKKREPISHIIGKREFYGRDFMVDKNVLDPRPDSESLIELVLESVKGNPNQEITMLEIGSGSGCLSITLLKEIENAKMTALDISQSALEVCRKNAALHGLDETMTFVQSDVFQGLRDEEMCKKRSHNTNPKFDIIISNPPYIKSNDIAQLQPEVKFYEPTLALDGGADGLDFYRKIAFEAKEFLNDNGKIFLEIGFDQKEDIATIFSDHGFTLEKAKKDLGGIERSLYFKHT